MGNQRFYKTERIKSKLMIDNLFTKGAESFTNYPIRVVYKPMKTTGKESVKILLSVPKKRIKHAVGRNRVKRLFRESYRLNKKELIEQLEQKENKLMVGLIYLSSNIIEFEEMNRKIKEILTQIKTNLTGDEKVSN